LESMVRSNHRSRNNNISNSNSKEDNKTQM
jgi:hypothetical protein